MIEYDNPINTKCSCCGKKLEDAIFDIAREYERVIFHKTFQLDEARIEIDVFAIESIAIFCSKQCRKTRLVKAIATQCINIPTHPPKFGPVETCAKCFAPVDMTDWHLSYLESDTNTTGTPSKPVEIEYIAVVCKKCAPFSSLINRIALSRLSDR